MLGVGVDRIGSVLIYLSAWWVAQAPFAVKGFFKRSAAFSPKAQAPKDLQIKRAQRILESGQATRSTCSFSQRTVQAVGRTFVPTSKP